MNIILIIIGIITSSLGLFFLITYLNLFSIGYNFLEYIQYIIKRVEIWLIPIGIFLIILGIERLNKHGILSRTKSEFKK